MMEFLDKIYGYEHFGIILFAAIAILVILFLIVLFFGKKDEKKRELERTQQLAAAQATDAFATVNQEAATLNVNEPTFAPISNNVSPIINETPVINPEPINVAQPVVDPIEQAPVISTVESVVNPVPPVMDVPVSQVVEPSVPEIPSTPVLEPIVEPTIVVPNAEPVNTVLEAIPEAPIFEPVSELVIPPQEEVKESIEIPDFNLDELVAKIDNELKALEELNKQDENAALIKPVNNDEKPIFNPEVPLDVPVTPIKDVVKPTPGPVTFSSVYINKPAEPVIPVQPQVQINEAVVEPVKPIPVVNNTSDIELPKAAEIPNLDNNNQNILNKEPVAVPDFSQFEGESYDIK